MYFIVTNKSTELSERLYKINPLFREYNSNIGYLFGRFTCAKLNDKDNKWDGRLPFHYKNFLKKVLPQKEMKEMLDEMCQANILKKYENSHISGNNSTYYEIIDKAFYDWDVESIHIKDIKNKFLLKNLNKMNDIRRSHLDANRLLVEDSLQYFTGGFDENVEKLFEEKLIKETQYKKFRGISRKYNKSNKVGVDKQGRTYNKNSTLPKILRRYVKFCGQGYWNLDIKTSQPVFFCNLLKNFEFISDEERDEFEKFYQIVFEQDIYSHFKSINHLECRDERKKQFYIMLFGKNYQMKHSKLFQEFQKQFPYISTRILNMKRFDHTNLARALQRNEAEFVYSVVIEKLRIIKPNLKLSTIHDSILCLDEDKELVINTMKESFYQLYKQKLNIGEEFYG